MGSLFSTSFARSQFFKYLIWGGTTLALGSLVYWKVLHKKRVPKSFEEIVASIEVSYDEEDDLDSNTIVAIIDAQNSSETVRALKDQFTQERRELMQQLSEEIRGKGDLFHLKEQPGPVLEAYLICVIKYERRICQELEECLDVICDRLSVTRDEIRKANEKYIDNKNSHKLLGTEECL